MLAIRGQAAPVKRAARMGLVALLIAALSGSGAVLADPQVRPCLDGVKIALLGEDAPHLGERNLKRCYREYVAKQGQSELSYAEFAMWVGLTASLERVEDSLDEVTRGEKVPRGRQQTGYFHELVEAYDLIRAYENNEFNADNRYKGKSLKISGKVSSVHKDPENGQLVLELSGDNFDIFNVYAFVTRRCEPLVRHLEKQETVELRGVVKGVNNGMHVDIEDAEVFISRTAGEIRGVRETLGRDKRWRR